MKLVTTVIVLLVLLTFATTLAQDDVCAAIVQQAITAVEDACAATARNEACYGNISVHATPRAGVENFIFEQQGDLVSIADLDVLRLRPLNPETNTWGIALMKLQANLPDTLPGQNVTFLLFGDVEIENAVESTPELTTIEVTATGGVNVRSGPSTNSPVIGSLSNGETVIANGRNSDAAWLRIQVPDSDALGWVFAELMTTAGDSQQLMEVDPADTELPFTPMQAFYFRTGVAETNCAEAPSDGILIQTPAGAGKINLRANDVTIQLGSTAYFQAQAGDMMRLSVVEGEAQVTAEGVTVTVPAGAQVEVPVDENLQAAGAPGEPTPYDAAALASLPVDALPELIDVAPPASEEIIQQSNQPPGAGGLPGAGIPGMIDPSALAGMDMTLFCPLMDQALADAGMSRTEYLGMLRQAMSLLPGDTANQMAEFEQLLLACP